LASAGMKDVENCDRLRPKARSAAKSQSQELRANS
jgi:hypothetical protein